MSFGAIERALGIAVPANNRKVAPGISDLKFEDVLSNTHSYVATSYISSGTKEHQVIFKKADGSLQPSYALSSSSAYLGMAGNAYARYRIAYIDPTKGEVTHTGISDSTGGTHSTSLALRPIVVLNSTAGTLPTLNRLRQYSIGNSWKVKPREVGI